MQTITQIPIITKTLSFYKEAGIWNAEVKYSVRELKAAEYYLIDLYDY